MKLKDLLNIQQIVEKRAIPSDVLEFDSTHYSRSKDMTVDILDLHLTHAIRILNNYLEDTLYPMDVFDRGEINNNLKGISALNKRIEERVDDLKEVVNK
jgi:hypothetical protein